MGRDITQCHPKLQVLAKKLVQECANQGLKIAISDCFRTVAEQDALYAIGRTTELGRRVVTNVKGSTYSSMHQWGVAFDIYRNDGQGRYNESGDFFTKVGQIGVRIGLEWGGNWKSFKDKPHFQLPDWGSTPSELKSTYGNVDNFKKTWNNNIQDGTAAVISGAAGTVHDTPKRMVHTVKAGETFWTIGKKWGIRAEAIQKANPHLDPRNLQVGTQVVIPDVVVNVHDPSRRNVHTVKAGETFWTIGEKWGVRVDAIQRANPHLNPKNLQVGTQVVIPNAIGGGDNPAPQPAPSPQPIPSPSGDKLEIAWNFFKNAGFSDGAAAGIMGNLLQESPTLDTYEIQHNPRTGKPDSRLAGRGIAQWDRADRWKALQTWAKNNGKDVYALETQLEFIMYELEHEPYTVQLLKPYGGVIGLKKLGRDDAVVAFLRCFERAGSEALESRKNYAKEIYNRFAQKVNV